MKKIVSQKKIPSVSLQGYVNSVEGIFMNI